MAEKEGDRTLFYNSTIHNDRLNRIFFLIQIKGEEKGNT